VDNIFPILRFRFNFPLIGLSSRLR